MELNPNHATTSTMRDHWHKLAAILVNRMHTKCTTITRDEISAIDGLAITIKDVGIGLELRIVSMDEGKQLASKEGGLPV